MRSLPVERKHLLLHKRDEHKSTKLAVSKGMVSGSSPYDDPSDRFCSSLSGASSLSSRSEGKSLAEGEPSFLLGVFLMATMGESKEVT